MQSITLQLVYTHPQGVHVVDLVRLSWHSAYFRCLVPTPDLNYCSVVFPYLPNAVLVGFCALLQVYPVCLR